jgi:two-component system vancomycin resistance associated response regulator VraR
MVNVMIVEDDPMAQKLLEIFVSQSGRYNVAHVIESAMLAESYCATNAIDLVLMDVCTTMNASGLDAAEKIKHRFPHIKVVIITSQPEFSFVSRARRAGVESFWYKTASAEEILGVMDRTMAGESAYPDNTPSLKLGDTLSEKFSERELEVLRLVIAGETDADIAKKLYISVSTVKQHIQSMRDKTGFRNRTELAVQARESGLVINDRKT